LGGSFVKLFASTYAHEVVGLILVDPYSEKLETLLTAGRWAALVRLNIRQGTVRLSPIPGYGDLKTLGYGKDNGVMRGAAASAPLRPMPRSSPTDVRLTCRRKLKGSHPIHWINIACSKRAVGSPRPEPRFFAAKDSGHDIHQDQPELVTEAMRQVIAGVHSPNTWYDLTSCRVK
jgi:pimeloyl-ACP methyl ester carboxylesterase